MNSFARSKASLSRLHILEVPLYRFLQKKCVQYQGYQAACCSQYGDVPVCMPVSMHCSRMSYRQRMSVIWQQVLVRGG